MFRLSRFALSVCAVSLFAATPPDAALSRAKAALAQLPLRFEANQGQWDPAVRYGARAGGYNLLLTARGPALSFPGSQGVGITLLHSNPAPRIEPLDRLPMRTDYFLGGREHWTTGVANYSRVRYRAVYPGVDVIYYGNQNQLEYDFVLQPGADPRAIRLQFHGAGHLRITPEGDLAFESAGARILQKKPLIYQEGPDASTRRQIAGRYTILARDVVGLRLDPYDRTRPLVIDPVLTYSTYMGGSGSDEITAVKLDAKGRLYITGWTTTGDLTAIDGAYNNNSAGLTDIFVAIVDTTQYGFPLQYFSYLGGANLDIPLAMDVDSQGVVYLTGTTTSTNFPIAGAAVQTTGAASTIDAFVVKLDPSQYGGVSLVYSTFLGGATGDEAGNGIAVDQNGMIYVIGTTKSTDFPVTDSAYAGVLYGAQDTFLAKVDPNSSSLAYATYLGGELADDGRGIAVTPNGLVYFAASTVSTQFPWAGRPYHTDFQGGADIIIGVMDMTRAGEASLVYSTYFGGSDIEEVRKIALDAKGNLLMTGYTFSADFPITPDAVQTAPGGNGDVFVTVLNPLDPAGFVVYSTYLGGSGGEVAYDIAGDNAGNIYVAGYTLSADFPVTKDAPQPLWLGGIDVFVAKLMPGVPGQAGLQYSTSLGGVGVHVANSIAVGPDGTLYVGGYTSIGYFPTTDSAAQHDYGGGLSDGFLLSIR